VLTWRGGTDPTHETQVTVDLAPAGDGTEMTITHERAADPRYREALAAGWVNVADRLDRLLLAR
jgi:uncharacterized protein YndB with AHSA1/START domain